MTWRLFVSSSCASAAVGGLVDLLVRQIKENARVRASSAVLDGDTDPDRVG